MVAVVAARRYARGCRVAGRSGPSSRSGGGRCRTVGRWVADTGVAEDMGGDRQALHGAHLRARLGGATRSPGFQSLPTSGDHWAFRSAPRGTGLASVGALARHAADGGDAPCRRLAPAALGSGWPPRLGHLQSICLTPGTLRRTRPLRTAPTRRGQPYMDCWARVRSTVGSCDVASLAA